MTMANVDDFERNARSAIQRRFFLRDIR